jgi:hypothetical protein
VAQKQAWEMLHEIADRAAPEIKKAFIEAIADAKKGVVLSKLQRALISGRLDQALQIAAKAWDASSPAFKSKFASKMIEIFERVSDPKVAAQMLPPQITMRFDMSNPLAFDYIQRYTSETISGIDAEIQKGIRAIVSQAFRTGAHPFEQARQIRELIGLSERDAKAVQNFRLRTEKMAEQTRVAGVTPRRGLTADRVDRIVRKYADKLLSNSAVTIARTATIDAANEAQRQLWSQAKRNGLLTGTWERVWIITPDDKLCPLCATMRGKRAPIDGRFGNGKLGPTLHPRCRCAVGLVRKRAQ